MSKITMDNFTMDRVIKTESGYFETDNTYSTSGKWNINYSDILTYLIQQTGRLCDYYASDLFIDWYSLISEIKADNNGNFTSRKMLFGLREHGVDHNNYVFSTMERYERVEHHYRALYMLEISVDGKKTEWKLGTVRFKRNI